MKNYSNYTERLEPDMFKKKEMDGDTNQLNQKFINYKYTWIIILEKFRH